MKCIFRSMTSAAAYVLVSIGLFKSEPLDIFGSNVMNVILEFFVFTVVLYIISYVFDRGKYQSRAKEKI